MAESVYENLQRAQLEGITLKEAALSPPPPSKRATSIFTLLAMLVLLLAVLLIAVTVLFFQKDRKLQELEGLAQQYSISLHLCNVSYASLEKSKRNLLGLVSAGWRFYNGSFYFFSQESKPWLEAEQACISHGVHLTSVTSREEMKFLVRESKGNFFWIGLTDRQEEGNWTWTDGSTFNHQVSFWDQKQPDNWNSAPEQREDCVHIRNNKLQSWNDLSCGEKIRWICKKVIS
ncbi:C-type lectin domain family 4 member K [Heteronotia binoei]|uniref:C-type lectin domain family 4 member K n=1 Tax=Heteronotia binoei TaxID=13085 RepID=UPI00292E5562|nr:C-type lectin domain family 4 member K [Heteronotia binoei]